MDRREHWESVYGRKASTAFSWYQRHLELSLALIAESGIGPAGAVIDIGGGDSTLAEDLVRRGYSDVTVLDVAAGALARAKERLGDAADRIHWLHADVLEAELPGARYDLWHDRAAFHFLVEERERRRYREQLSGALRPGGQVILAAFADDGPSRCSGLPTMRYSPAAAQAELGERFVLLGSRRQSHITPEGKEQRFIYLRLEMKGG